MNHKEALNIKTWQERNVPYQLTVHPITYYMQAEIDDLRKALAALATAPDKVSAEDARLIVGDVSNDLPSQDGMLRLLGVIANQDGRQGRCANADMLAADIRHLFAALPPTQPEKAENAALTEAAWEARKAELALQYPGIAGDYKVFEVAIVTETGCDPSDGEFLVHVSRLIHGWVSNDDLHHIHTAIWEEAKNLSPQKEGIANVIAYESGEREDVFWNKYFKVAAIASQKENGG